jgi:hypothetical protein
MKSVRLPFVLLVLLVCATAGGGEIIRQGVLIPYEITGPDGWTYYSKPHQYVLGVFEPDGDDLYPYISLTKVGGPFQRHFTPEELVERNLYERPGAHLLSSRWIERENGDYLLAEFDWSSELGDVRAIKAFYPSEHEVLVVTAVCLASDFDQYQPVFFESVKSVQIKVHPDEAKKRRKAAQQPTGDDWLYDDQ